MKKALLSLPAILIGCMGNPADTTDGSAASNAPAALLAAGQAQEIDFASDPSWKVSGPASGSLGSAQNVCLNSFSPANCPAGAAIYGWLDPAWGTSLSSIPGATWIWAPGITGTTAPAYPAEYLFSKEFELPGTPLAGSISFAADDYAEAIVNGTLVGTIGSLTDVHAAQSAQAALRTFDITSLLVSGKNVIAVRGKNGPYGCGNGQYGCNPAGVVFGGSLRYLPDTSVSALTVEIEVNPRFCFKPIGSNGPGKVGISGHGKIPVAILTASDFDAVSVDPASVRFGKTGVEATASHSLRKDVNRDGKPDLLLYFETPDTGILCGDSVAVLTGKTASGTPIQGTDAIQTKCGRGRLSHPSPSRRFSP